LVAEDNRRRHDVPTGRPPGAPKGSANAFKHGLSSAAAVAHRNAFAAILRETRRLIREAVE
jgi:hypothetical protein